ncbi:MAG: hypothetical protein RIQ94_1715, partial [Pseudomonadota bacterium]
SFEKIEQLEALPLWSWYILEDQWYESFNSLKKYINEYGCIKISRDLKYEECYLGRWIKQQRTNKDKLSSERKALLESLSQWSWGVKSE